MKIWPKIYLVAVLLMASGGAIGSDGSESPFSFGAGARELALGGAAITGADDATAVFWNPSRLTLAQKISLTGMHSELLIDGAVYQYFGMVFPTLDLGGFGLGLFRQSIQNIEKRGTDNSYLGEFDDSHLRLYLGYGRSLGKFKVGASLSLDHQSIDIYRATSSPGLTLAVTHRHDPKPAWLSDLTVAAVARSVLKPGIKLAEETYRYPTVLELSGSVRVVQSNGTDHSLEPFITVRKVESIPVNLHAGLEYTYKETLQLRTGLRQKNFSFGAGLKLGTISFDYALVDRDLDYVHLFALTGSFGLSVEERRKSRADKQEADFRQAMNLQMRQRNLALIDELLAAGRDQLASDKFEEAVGSFDRLVFLARSTGIDDAEYQKLLDSALELRTTAEETNLLEAAVDSAAKSFEADDFLSARYHASLALQSDSTCERARELFEKADTILKSRAERSEFLAEQLARIDSLLDSNRLDQAELVIRSLTAIAPEDDAVMRRINRLELERLRKKIADMEARRHDSTTQIVRSAGDDSGAGTDKTGVTAGERPAQVLSEAEQDEMQRLYQQAKQLFNDGDIKAAIRQWEIVASRAPDFQSVSEFLVKAYKFLGLELYGQKQRAEAIAVWKKALALDPDNTDIAEYIKRAETQMKKLKELAHEQP
ncbi:MAG: tetratricopeptide repeat protein [Candidatus Zixiibacteriota bacterium]|nr:MAG: tetratricopeptide repeat protein [candidate division Zixibacteria bacterium]